MKLKSKDTIDLVVQTVLSKLQEILEKGGSPVFIFNFLIKIVKCVYFEWIYYLMGWSILLELG